MPILSCTKYILIHSLLFKDFRSIASPKLEKAQVSGQPTLLAHFMPLTKPDENLNCRVHIHWSACQSIRSRRHAACKGKSLAIRMSACVLTWNQCVFVYVCVCESCGKKWRQIKSLQIQAVLMLPLEISKLLSEIWNVYFKMYYSVRICKWNVSCH